MCVFAGAGGTQDGNSLLPVPSQEVPSTGLAHRAGLEIFVYGNEIHKGLPPPWLLGYTQLYRTLWGLTGEQGSSHPPGAQTGGVEGVGRAAGEHGGCRAGSLNIRPEKHPGLGLGEGLGRLPGGRPTR